MRLPAHPRGLRRATFCLALMAIGPAAAARSEPALPLPRIEIDRADLVSIAAIDPMHVIDDDFARLRDPALWQGLSVQRIGLREGDTAWRLWRIVNRTRRTGPLWVIPHDNENATFAAAVDAVRSWGGAAIVVDTGAIDQGYAARFNADVGAGTPIDPNRHFRADRPLYAGVVLDDLKSGLRPIIALHTNARGFDPRLPACPGRARGTPGSGDIAIGLCSNRFSPRPSRRAAWPFDDDDTLVLTPYLAGATPDRGYCLGPMAAADFNLVFERVAQSDGSLSNYAAEHDLPYLNFETRDLGNGLAGVAQARGRLIAMIDTMMERCAPIEGLSLDPAATAKDRRAGRRRR
ncbi:MAG: hypothetical protein B7Y45_11025 [Sphingomonas sp. 28-66-16]|nr:MAG: hypothetical protein B7Y45_11025 [Sphingomonas sp. 28-66-16]